MFASAFFPRDGWKKTTEVSCKKALNNNTVKYGVYLALLLYLRKKYGCSILIFAVRI
jgi:hypothetical protein